MVGAEKVGLTEAGIIDVHAHPLTLHYHALVQKIRELGGNERFSYRSFLPPKLPEWSAAKAIESMQREGVRAQVLSLPDATIELRGDAARRIAREVNEMMADIVARYPGRFAAFAVVPHDDLDATLSEIEYALDTLKLDGIATTSNIRGAYLGDPSFDPWLAELHRRGAVLFVHPMLSASTLPVSPLFIEFSFDSCRMVINMVLSGAKRRFSDIKLLSTHGGGAIPFLSSRLEELAPALLAKSPSREEIWKDLRSFYFDLTSCMADAPLAAATRFVPSSRLMLGFDSPFLALETVRPSVQRLSSFDGISDQEKRRIMSGNALILFPRLQGKV